MLEQFNIWTLCLAVLCYSFAVYCTLVWYFSVSRAHVFFKITAFSLFVLLSDSIAYTPSGETLCYPRHLKWLRKAWSLPEGSSVKNGAHAAWTWSWDAGCETMRKTFRQYKCICCSCLLWGRLLSSYGEDEEHFEEVLGRGGSSELVWGAAPGSPWLELIAVLVDRSLYRTLMFGKKTNVFLRVTVELSVYCFFPF